MVHPESYVMGIGVERPIFKSNYSYPQTSSSLLTAFRTHVVSPRSNTRSETDKFFTTRAMMYWSCWIPTFDHIAEILRRSAFEEAEKPQTEERALIVDWKWHQDILGQWFEEAESSNNWTWNHKDACLLLRNSEWEGDILVPSDTSVLHMTRLQCSYPLAIFPK